MSLSVEVSGVWGQAAARPHTPLTSPSFQKLNGG